MLLKVEEMVGTTGMTNGDQITQAARKVFGKRFKGIYPVHLSNEPSARRTGSQGVPKLKEGELAMLNEDLHWWMIFRKHNKLYETDSYNLDHLKNYIDVKQPKSFIQGPAEANCGQRAIVDAYFAIKK